MDGGGIYVKLYMISSSAFPIISAKHQIACELCVTDKNLYWGLMLMLASYLADFGTR